MMESVQTGTEAGAFRAFITNGGPHNPETLAEMTFCQLFAPMDDPAYYAAQQLIKGALKDMHESIQNAVRALLPYCSKEPGVREQVFRVLLRDLATSMENERGYHKE